ncbi:unnamed protein product [Camellia sinensis]
MRKLSIIVMLWSMAIAMPVVRGIAETPKDVEEWFYKLSTNKVEQKVTKLPLYFQNVKGITTAVVAQANSTATSDTSFGLTFLMDSPLTVGPSQSSKVIGRAQGRYGAASTEEVPEFIVMNLVFIDENYYNGSTLTVLGSNPSFHKKRELTVVGGTGVFRLARGVALLNTYFFNAALGNATVEF